MESNSQNFLDKITPSDILSVVDGIPLPPVVKKSAWKAIGSLVTGLVDIPLARLEAKSQKIRGEAEALAMVTRASAEAAAIQFGKDQYLVDRSINHFASKLFKEQVNRENIAEKALDELKTSSPIEDSEKEIDLDWLEMFSKLAESKSNEDVQLFLSKMLAGEIKKPGSFSLKTIQILSTLDQNISTIFQSFCDVSFSFVGLENQFSFVITSPFGEAGGNALKDYNLNYSNLTVLQDAGLIQGDLNSWREIPKILFASRIIIGTTVQTFKIGETASDKIKINVINFTQAGIELKGVLHIGNVEEYNNKVYEWFNAVLGNNIP